MPKKRYPAEQIIRHLREAEVELAKGQTRGGVCRKLGITEQTYYRWRKEYGSLRVDQVRRLKELERENGRLKKLVADQALDLAILKETSNGFEFTARLVRDWLERVVVKPLFIEPASPWENGYVESFNGKFRDEFLNGEIFYTLQEAKVLIEGWRRE